MSIYLAQLIIGLTVLFIYLIIMAFVSGAYIQLANQRWLRAHQAALRSRLQVQQSDPPQPTGTEATLAAIDMLLPSSVEPDGADGRWRKGWSPRNWVGSCEIAEWVQLHEAQRLEVWRLPDLAVEARFARAMGQIAELPPVRQNAWQRRWTELQGASRTVAGQNGTAAKRWRAELSQLLAELFNARDATYNQLVSLYGKAGWLVLAAYLPVVALLGAGYGFVLLGGFLGGLISRIQRLVYARGWPTAYGISWVPLFLAPLLGALAAWGGLHLLAMLQSIGVIDLGALITDGETFKQVPPAGILGLAVLLGFSERFFNQIGAQAEQVITGEPDSGSAAAAGSPTSSFRQVDGVAEHPESHQHPAVEVKSGIADDATIRNEGEGPPAAAAADGDARSLLNKAGAEGGKSADAPSVRP